MSAIRVAHVDELPPGKGVTVEVGGHIVTVYNAEGRYYATVEPAGGAGPDTTAPACTSTACLPHQRRSFDATSPDAPVRAGHAPSLSPHVEGEWVMLTLDEPAAG